MTNLDSHAPGRTSPLRDLHFDTLYRDTPLTSHTGRRVVRPLPVGDSHLEVPEGEHFSDGLLAALAALTLPVVGYSFVQLWSLLAGGALTQAIRAFLP